MHIAYLYRYPVKGLSPERLQSVPVAPKQGFPLDRMYALLRTQVVFDPAAPAWLAKANFVMLMLHERVAALKTHYSDSDRTLHVRIPDGRTLDFALDSPAGRSALEQFFAEFIPKQLTATPRLVEASGHQFTDKAEKFVSLINLSSVRELEKRWNESLNPLRFRANVFIDDAEPFSELDWVGQEIQLGSVRARVIMRNGRCAATNVNPETGVRDRNIPGKLREAFGHKDLGVYLSVLQDGELCEGDAVKAAPHGRANDKPADVAARAAAQLICTACYYLFDPRDLNAAWTGPRDLPESWRCPDCGSSKGAVGMADAR